MGNAGSDDLAIKQAQRGDHEAFRALVDRHTQQVFRLAWRMTGNTNDAEDVVQETFLRAWKQLGKFDGRAAFGTWVHRIGANCALDHIRSRKAKAEGPLELPAAMAHSGPSPERLARSQEITGLLIPALDELTAMERAAFVLRHYEGLPILDISRALGVEPGAAKHSVFRAVQKLRRALEIGHELIAMNHLTEEDLVLLYYNEPEAANARAHLAGCAICRAAADTLATSLDACNEWLPPDVDAELRRGVWAVPAPQLAQPKSFQTRWWFEKWRLLPQPPS